MIQLMGTGGDSGDPNVVVDEILDFFDTAVAQGSLSK